MATNNFLCPFCRGYINTNGHVVFSARTESGNQGLLFLSDELGNYQITSHPHFNIADGEFITLYCPICHANLIDRKRDKHLARILMVDEQHNEHEIVISGIVGEHCTYKLSDSNVEKYGEDSNLYEVGLSYIDLVNFR